MNAVSTLIACQAASEVEASRSGFGRRRSARCSASSLCRRTVCSHLAHVHQEVLNSPLIFTALSRSRRSSPTRLKLSAIASLPAPPTSYAAQGDHRNG